MRAPASEAPRCTDWGDITILGGRTFGKDKGKATLLGFHPHIKLQPTRTGMIKAIDDISEALHTKMTEGGHLEGWLEINVVWGKEMKENGGAWGAKIWMHEHGDFTALRAQILGTDLIVDAPPAKAYERTVENMVQTAIDRNQHAANGTSATVSAPTKDAATAAIQKIEKCAIEYEITPLKATFFRVTAKTVEDLLKIGSTIGDPGCRINKEKAVPTETVDKLKAIQQTKTKSFAEAASRSEERNGGAAARMKARAKKAALKKRNTPAYVATVEEKAAAYRLALAEEQDALAEDEAMDQVDAEEGVGETDE